MLKGIISNFGPELSHRLRRGVEGMGWLRDGSIRTPFSRRGVCAINKKIPFLNGADGVVSKFQQNKVRYADICTDRVDFRVINAGAKLPFPPEVFDVIVSNDAMCHIDQRLAVLREWHRVLRREGRVLFTYAMVITGPVSHEELAIRSSIGFYLFVPPGENERLLREAGLSCWRSMTLPVAQPRFPGVGAKHEKSIGKLS